MQGRCPTCGTYWEQISGPVPSGGGDGRGGAGGGGADGGSSGPGGGGDGDIVDAVMATVG